MRFLPFGWFTAVFPPTELSTCASRVVGTCMKGTPLRYVAATKPAMSPITPPPRAIIGEFLSMRFSIRAS